MRTAFLSKYLMADPREAWIEDAALIVEGGRVAWAGSRDRANMEGAEVVDLGAAALIPGFVNAHAHVAMTLLRGVGDGLPVRRWLSEAVWPVEADMDEDVIYYGNLLGVAEQLRSGITSFVDFYNVEPMLRVLREVPMRAVLTLAFMDRVQYMEEESWRRIEAFQSYMDMVREAGGGRLSLAIGPHAPYSCSKEMLEKLAELSGKYGMHVHTHLAETEDEVEIMRREARMSPAEYLNALGLVNERLIAAHGVHLSEGDMRILGQGGANVVHCPRSNSRLGVGIADVRGMLEAGINIALGTDGPASCDSTDMFEEMRLMVYLQRAARRDPSTIRARDALVAATLGSARAAGLSDEGALLPGFRADFSVIDLGTIEMRPIWDLTTNIVLGAGARNVKEVYLSGERAVAEGDVVLGDIRIGEALERAEEFRLKEIARGRGAGLSARRLGNASDRP